MRWLFFAGVVFILLVSGCASFPPDPHGNQRVPLASRQELIDTLEQVRARVKVASPPITTWSKDSVGSFAVGIQNQNADQSTFYIHIYLEDIGGLLSGRSVADLETYNKNWLTYSSEESIDAGSIKTTDVIINPGESADSGVYKFRVVVCESQPCTTLNETDPSKVYGSDSFAIELE